ncbi:type VI secretion system contractile sheath large subunit [Alkalimonas collagenimarina]|uniref:Type VI secretion system contractile sheath large subunit n=1 Tax=Alkalimonas collagenimarina TaxID=400390 RepID=A0ABT9H301_9GAMM|nr:type VI secretion system contractile sheath large subunit [Alkalimonas collagenimarina]MDP4537667.1 type VI secretion system contractile sheath large subunit [Alkalimonas collagenimarina]
MLSSAEQAADNGAYASLFFVDEGIFADPSDPTTKNKHRFEQSITLSKLLYFLREHDPVAAASYWADHIEAERPTNVQQLLHCFSTAIASIDHLLNLQVNAILHHASLQQLEASWRGILYLLEQTELHDREQKVKVKLLPLNWNELSRDLNRAIDFDQSEFFKLIYENEFDMPGGEPFGVLIGDYQLSHTIRPGQMYHDLDILKEIAKVSAAAFAPFISAVDSAFFGINNFSELGQVHDISSQFKQPEYIRWQQLREMEDTRFLGLVMPQVLMRAPYLDNGTRSDQFRFKEQLTDQEQDYLWGNAGYALAAVLVRAFSESGWFAQIRGMKPGHYNFGVVNELPRCNYNTDLHRQRSQPSVNLQIGHRFESELADNGFIPLCAVPYSDIYAFYSNSSVQKTKRYDTATADVNARLSSMLQHILCVSRFAHYIKVIGRDKVGGYQTAKECEQDLQRWLYQYTTATDDASNEIRARHPLRNAQIQVREKPGEPGKYYSIIHLQPHFQLEQMLTTVKLVAELSPQQSNKR